MDFLPLLAQDNGPGKRVLQRLLESYPAAVAVPAFIAVVIVVGWMVERGAVTLLRRMAARTTTKIDDAFAESLPTLLRPLFVLVSLHVLVHQYMYDQKETSKLSADGEFAAKALMVVSIVVLAVAVVRSSTRMIDAWALSAPERHAVGAPIKLGVKFAMVPISFLAALQAIDYPIGSLVTALGLGSLAVGLALQDTLKNMFAGIQIVLDRPVRVGDFVEIDRNTRGSVIEVGLRSTKLRSVENNVVVIPNNTIANAIVVNFDVHDRRCFQTLTISVAYGVDTRRVQQVLEQVAADAQKDIPAIADEPARVWLRDLGESGVNFSVEITMRQYPGRLSILTELYHRFYERLRAEGIEIPFPTRTIHVRHDGAATAAGPPVPPSR